MSSPGRKGKLDLGLHLSSGEIHAKEAPACGMEQNGGTQQASPWLNSSSVMIGSQGSMDFSAAQPVGMASESMTSAGYCLAPPKLDPLQLTIGPNVPDINLNLLPVERQAAPVFGKTWSGMKTAANPFERPLLQRVGRKDPQFGPFILESSEVAREYAERQREAAEANNKRTVVREELHAGPVKRKHRYIWPAETVANINENIEQLKKEALVGNPAERRSLQVIEAEIDALQAKKDVIHARVFGQGSSKSAPPPFLSKLMES